MGGNKQVPSPLARYIDPAWRLLSQGDHGLRRDLGGVLGLYLAQHRIAVTAMGDTLVIACHDRGCATELRFLQRDIRKTLEATGHHGIERVRILLSGSRIDNTPVARSTARKAIPPAARQALRSAAASITDPKLSEALRRLARAGLEGDPGAPLGKVAASGANTGASAHGERPRE